MHQTIRRKTIMIQISLFENLRYLLIIGSRNTRIKVTQSIGRGSIQSARGGVVQTIQTRAEIEIVLANAVARLLLQVQVRRRWRSGSFADRTRGRTRFQAVDEGWKIVETRDIFFDGVQPMKIESLGKALFTRQEVSK